MKIYLKGKNEKGKSVGLGGDKTIDIDIMVGNSLLASFQVTHGGLPESSGTGYVLYDKTTDGATHWIEDKKKGQMTKGECAECGEINPCPDCGGCKYCTRACKNTVESHNA